MVFTITAKTNTIQLLKLMLKNMSPEKMDKVLVRAENRTASMTRTAIVRLFKSRSTLNTIKIYDGGKVIKRHKPIDKRVTVHKAPDAATGAGITISHKRISLVAFGGKQLKRDQGASYEISEDAGRTTIASSFIQKGKGGTEGIFIRRVGQWTKLKNPTRLEGRGFSKQWEKTADGPQRVPRYPIDLLKGPSLWKMFVGVEDMAAEIVAEANVKLDKHIRDQIGLIVNRSKGAVA